MPSTTDTGPNAPALLLWLDFETTNVDVENTTVLEAAWAVTLRGMPEKLPAWQLTPLRSRLCAVAAHSERVDTPYHNGPTFGWQRSGMGAGGVDVPTPVKNMHTTSGLAADWCEAHDGGRVVEHGAALDRLIADDVQAAMQRWRALFLDPSAEPTAPKVHVAGDGVGHFDQRILARSQRSDQRPQFPLTSRYLHYRPEDISHAVHALTRLDEPMHHLLARDAQDRRDRVGHVLCLDLDNRLDAPSAGALEEWVTAANTHQHRAAPDVVRAMLAWLIANDRVGDLLGVPS